MISARTTSRTSWSNTFAPYRNVYSRLNYLRCFSISASTSPVCPRRLRSIRRPSSSTMSVAFVRYNIPSFSCPMKIVLFFICSSRFSTMSRNIRKPIKWVQWIWPRVSLRLSSRFITIITSIWSILPRRHQQCVKPHIRASPTTPLACPIGEKFKSNAKQWKSSPSWSIMSVCSFSFLMNCIKPAISPTLKSANLVHWKN